MSKAKLTLVPLEDADRNQFVLDNQEAFKYGATEEFGMRNNHFEEDGEIISRDTIERAIDKENDGMLRFQKVMENQTQVKGVKATELLRGSKSWDGTEMPDYPVGRPELVAMRYEFAAGEKLGWHHHEVMNYGYLAQGELTIVDVDGNEKVFRTGEALIEMVGTIHRGENRGTEPVVLYMFYVSQQGLPLSVPHPEIG